MKPGGVEKTTKCCDLTVYLLNGVRLMGTYHVPTGTSSSIRPSDALRETTDSFLLLTNVTVHDSSGSNSHPAMLVRVDAISHVDLPKGWASRTPGAGGWQASEQAKVAGAVP